MSRHSRHRGRLKNKNKQFHVISTFVRLSAMPVSVDRPFYKCLTLVGLGEVKQVIHSVQKNPAHKLKNTPVKAMAS
jgi:hypothetical protein